MYFTRIASLSLFAFIAACSSSSSAPPPGPVIDDFEMNSTASVATVTISGQQVTGFDMKGSISFHDDAENIGSFTIHLDVPGAATQDQQLQLGQPVKQVTNQQFEFVLDQSAPKEDIQVTVTAVAVSGKKSDPKTATVTLQ